jgi:hypothetical protein
MPVDRQCNIWCSSFTDTVCNTSNFLANTIKNLKANQQPKLDCAVGVRFLPILHFNHMCRLAKWMIYSRCEVLEETEPSLHFPWMVRFSLTLTWNGTYNLLMWYVAVHPNHQAINWRWDIGEKQADSSDHMDQSVCVSPTLTFSACAEHTEASQQREQGLRRTWKWSLQLNV